LLCLVNSLARIDKSKQVDKSINNINEMAPDVSINR